MNRREAEKILGNWCAYSRCRNCFMHHQDRECRPVYMGDKELITVAEKIKELGGDVNNYGAGGF